MNNECSTSIRLVTKYVALILALSAQTGLAQDRYPSWSLKSNYGVQGEFSIFIAEAIDLQASYYVKPIPGLVGPFAEYDFLNPNSVLSMRVVSEKSEGGREDLAGYHIGLEHSVLRGNHLYKPGVQYTTHDELETLGIGFEYTNILTESSRAFGSFNLNNEQIASGDSVSNRVKLGYRKLWRYSRGSAFAAKFALESTRAENESRSFTYVRFRTKLDYYFSRRWGIGLMLSNTEADIDRFDSVGLGLSTSYYFNPNVGIDLDVGIAQDGENVLKGGAGLSLIVRF